MNKAKKIITSVACGVALMGAVALSIANTVPALAAGTDEIKNGCNAIGGCDDGQSLPQIAQTVIDTMLFIVGILAVAMIIFSGIRYITAHGDKGQVENAKNTLIYSIVGLIVAIIAYAIVGWVVGLFDKGGTSALLVTSLFV